MGTQMNIQQSSYLVLNLPSIITKFHHNNPLSSSSSSSKFPCNSTLIYNNPKTHLLKPILNSFSNPPSPPTNSNNEQKWVHEGTVSENLPNGLFLVNCDNGEVILGYVSGKMRRGSIRIIPGDRVKVEVSRYDSGRGRIIYRTRG